nr:hypothetical protein [Tanacetum cinerariifolium]
MADSWKAMDLNKFVVKDDMVDYVLHMYGSNWQVHDAIVDDILDDLLKREWEKQKRVKYKYDKRKVTQMKIQDLLEKRIEKAGQHLNNQALRILVALIVLGNKKKLLKNRGLDLPKRKKTFEGKQWSRSTKAKKATISSEIAQWYDDFSSDEVRTVYKALIVLGNKKKLLKNRGLDLPKRKKTFEGKRWSRSTKAKKATIPSEIAQWYDDFSSDE